MKIAAAHYAALRAAQSIVSIKELADAGTLSGNNARETARQIREDIAALAAFVDNLDRARVQ